MIKTGDKIKEFSLPDSNGEMFNLSSVLGKKNLVIYFYPKDETKGCTMEACSFCDNYQDFKDMNAEVIGISSDSPEKHKQFAYNHKLPFILLSDENKLVRSKFGVPNDIFGLVPGRVTYIIDKNATVRYIFNSLLQAEKHVKESIRILKEI